MFGSLLKTSVTAAARCHCKLKQQLIVKSQLLAVHRGVGGAMVFDANWFSSSRKERKLPRARQKAVNAENVDEEDTFDSLPPIMGRQGAVTAASEEQPDADTFGTLSSEWNEKISPAFNFAADDRDEQDKHEEKVADTFRPGKLSFQRKIEDLVFNKKDLRAALEVLDVEMREELVQPEHIHYRILIHACAEAGHVKKAFKLHKERRDRGFRPSPAIYTDLFFACTNHHDRGYGLLKATRLLNSIRESHFNPNRVLYNSMVQAFGRCGDLTTALNLVDEMSKFKFPLTNESYSFLLQGCLSDKTSGFRHAIIIWRNMRRKGFVPNAFNYNLIFRVAKECGIGDPKLLQDLLLESVRKDDRNYLEARITGNLSHQQKDETNLLSQGGSDSNVPALKWWEMDIKQMEMMEESGVSPKPSLLEPHPSLMQVLELKLNDTAKDRMMLLGDVKQIIDCMKSDGVDPDIRTFSILLTAMNTSEAEAAILSAMEEAKLQPDTAFYNQIIKSRFYRGDLAAGINSLVEMNEHGVTPDILTFGCIALCCNTRKEGLDLLRSIHEFGARPNREIMSSLITGAMRKLHLANVILYLEIMENEGITADKRLIAKMENFNSTYRKLIWDKDHGRKVPYLVNQESKDNYTNWRKFEKKYKTWLEGVSFDDVEDPTLQYRTTRDIQRAEKGLR
eukprot:TRINITY_DN11855_c0_g1_i6.p1 TRINITY_DN11855_c0_g1~~TRINITY_DN11855_c0_g1_i6.p1  ORF type:complete len:678 (-),score=114.46 TRINITY_DN11855_c0_g1_i6:148-2181(-)